MTLDFDSKYPTKKGDKNKDIEKLTKTALAEIERIIGIYNKELKKIEVRYLNEK